MTGVQTCALPISPKLVDHDLETLSRAPERLTTIYETVRRVSGSLPPETTLLGFAGSPWTVATYMIAGQGSKEQAEARRYAYRDPKRFAAIIDAIADLTVIYLRGQIDAGADAVQLFDSWSGSLSPAQFEQWVIAPTARIVASIRETHAATPIIGFPKGAGGKLIAYAEQTGVSAIGIDETVDPLWAARSLPAGLPVQGNLDPLALIAGGQTLFDATARILTAFADRPHVFNLGHGILPDTPIAHVEALIKQVRG